MKTKGTTGSEWQFNNDESIESKTKCIGKVIKIDTNSKLSVAVVAVLIVSNHTKDSFSMYQRWTQNCQTLSILSGPYSFVNATTDQATRVDGDTCDIGKNWENRMIATMTPANNFILEMVERFIVPSVMG